MADPSITVFDSQLESGKPARIWYGLLAPPLAWMIQSSIAWFIVGRTCADFDPSWGVLAAGGVRVLLGAIGVAAFIAAALALFGSLGAWREASRPGEDVSVTDAEGRRVPEYLSILGVLMSALFLLAIVWTTIPAVWLPMCEGMR
jgi:hypothetical protein